MKGWLLLIGLLGGLLIFVVSLASIAVTVMSFGVAAICGVLIKRDAFSQGRRLLVAVLLYAVLVGGFSMWAVVGEWMESAAEEEAAEQKMAVLKMLQSDAEKAIGEARFGDAELAIERLAARVAPTSPTLAELRTKLKSVRDSRRKELVATLEAHISEREWTRATSLCAGSELVSPDAELQARCAVVEIGGLVGESGFDDAWTACKQRAESQSPIPGADELCEEAGRSLLAIKREAVLAAHASHDWTEGRELCVKLGSATEGDDRVEAACEVIRAEHEKAETKRKRAARKIEVEAKTEGVIAVVEDEKKCDTPLAVSDAWESIRDVTKEDPGFSNAARAVRRLERCRKKIERDLTRGLATVMKKQREEYASRLERVFLDEGMDIRVRAGGTTLKLTFVLFNRAWAHKLTDGGSMAPGSVLGTSEGLGFRRVVFSDGYRESYSYKLEPKDEKDAIRERAMLPGLRSPLKL